MLNSQYFNNAQNVKLIEKLFKKFKEIKQADYNENTVIFLEKYLVNIQANIQRKRQKFKSKTENYEDLKYELYDYDLLWNLIVAPSESKISSKIKEKAIDSLMNVISNNKDLIDNYLLKCSKGSLTNNESALMEIKLFKKLYSFLRSKQAPKDYAKNLIMSPSVLTEILKRLFEYKIYVSQAIQASAAPIQNIFQHVFCDIKGIFYIGI